MAATTTQLRCPRCGNEVRADFFVCTFCGKRLRFEKIENFSIFKRIESNWTTPDPWYKILLWLFIKPNKAFWSINHRRKSAPGYIILLFNALLYGIMGLAFFSHFNIQDVPPLDFRIFFYNLSIFIAFVLFGLAYFFIFGFILIWLFTKGANYAVGFSEKLESYLGSEAKEQYREAEMSPFSIYKGGTLHQQQAFKYKMMFCSFTPFILINIVEIIIVLIGFGSQPINILGLFDPLVFNDIFSSPTWTILHTIDAITVGIWVPILVALSIRELSNSSTTRVLLSSLIIGIVVALLFFFLRPTF
ncbi:MAG: hypothetical protein ACFFFB_04960 [Candidatus Heimdallarchaeota archaeon]